MLNFKLINRLLTLIILYTHCGSGFAFQSDTQNFDQAPKFHRVEAFAGRPFGVGLIRYRMCAGDDMIDQSGATLITEKNNRIFYPVFARPPINRFFQKLAGNANGEPESMHNVWFLFRGDQPLEINLLGACSASKIIPVENTREKKFTRSLTQWWREFNLAAERQLKRGDYPPLVEMYLKSMLSSRIGLPLPTKRKKKKDQLTETLELIFDVESLRSETIEKTMFGLADSSPANQPIPNDVFWQSADLNPVNFEDVAVEPFAQCVPEECFYLRFGTWSNQIWLRTLMDEFGGDLSRMVNLRGYKSRIKSKFLNQLAIESSEFDKLFGGNLIADVAVIGNDMFFDDGASVGVLLHAKNSKTLTRNLTNKRKKFSEKNAGIGCELTEVEIDGVQVQYLKTPDNRYRSFYVVRGDNHLVTSSLSLARRFIEAAGGKRSLAKSLEFRYARQQMPLSRDDTVFIYVPSKFLYQLLSPKYQIELARRNRSITDMQIVELSALAAYNEGFDTSNVENLITHGFLPNNFGMRPDGSILTKQGRDWVDSIRGRRGFFAPISDLRIENVTPAEVEWYRERRAFFSENLVQLDPMFIALKRYGQENNVERIVYDARIAPFGQEKYDWLFSMLGPPISQEIKGTTRDVVTVQASLDGGSISKRIGQHQFFGAVQNEQVPAEIKSSSILQTLELFKNVPGYVGSWPKAGYLDWLPRLGGQPDQHGFTYSKMLGLWRLQWEDFSAVAFEANRLMELQQQLQIVPSDRPAQVRIHVGDLYNSNLREWANSQSYRRSWETSLANARLLNLVAKQFNLSPKQSRQIIENLLDVELVCSLRGEYKLEETQSREIWHSTAWPDFDQPQLPAEYVSPLLTWFRGFDLELVQSREQFSIHGFLDVQRTSTSSLPSFDLFKGFGSVFGTNTKQKTSGDKKEPLRR